LRVKQKRRRGRLLVQLVRALAGERGLDLNQMVGSVLATRMAA
jgi:hypothetical protein